MYGAKYVGTLTGISAVPAYKEFTVLSGTTITRGDFVKLDSGYLICATATTEILGTADQTATGTAAGVKCRVNVDPDALYLVDNDNAVTTFAVTHPGTYFDITGATAVQQVDTSSTTSTGSLFCHEYNPQIAPFVSDTSIGLFQIAEKQGYKSQ